MSLFFCFLRALDNQVYAASVSAAKINDTAFLCYGLTLHCGEVVVSAGDEEAIKCTDIGELLSLYHQYCVTW